MKTNKYMLMTAATLTLTLSGCSPLDDEGVWTDSVTAVLDWKEVDENGLRPKEAGGVNLYVFSKEEETGMTSYPMNDEHLSMQLAVGKFSMMAFSENVEAYLQGTPSFQDTRISLPVREGAKGLEITSMPTSQLYAGFTDNVSSLADKQVMTDIVMLPVLRRLDITLLVRDSLEYKGPSDIALTGITTSMRLNSQTQEAAQTAVGRIALQRAEVQTEGKDILSAYRGEMIFPDVVAMDNLLTVTLEDKSKKEDYFKDMTEFLEAQHSKEMTVILTLDKRTGEIDGRAYSEGDIDEMNIYF